MVNLGRCVGSCNTLNDLSDKVCVPNKTKDLNWSMFNMSTEINESKKLTKCISCGYTCKFDGKKYNPDESWCECKNIIYVKNIMFGILHTCKFDGKKYISDEYWCECKKHHICEKDYVWNPATCKCENEINLVSIIDDSTIICDEIINVKERNFNEKNITCKTKKFYILLDFLLITLALLMVVSIFCYLIKYQFHSTNNKLNKW